MPRIKTPLVLRDLRPAVYDIGPRQYTIEDLHTASFMQFRGILPKVIGRVDDTHRLREVAAGEGCCETEPHVPIFARPQLRSKQTHTIEQSRATITVGRSNCGPSRRSAKILPRTRRGFWILSDPSSA